MRKSGVTRNSTVLRIERDRHGAIRAFPGPKLSRPVTVSIPEPSDDIVVPADDEPVTESVDAVSVVSEPVVEPPIEEAETIDETVTEARVEQPKPASRRRSGGAKSAQGRRGGKAAKPRARKSVRAKAVAADSGE